MTNKPKISFSFPKSLIFISFLTIFICGITLYSTYNVPKTKIITCDSQTNIYQCNAATGCAWYACANLCRHQGTPTGDVCPSLLTYCASFVTQNECSQHSSDPCIWSDCTQSCTAPTSFNPSPCKPSPTPTSLPQPTTPPTLYLPSAGTIITKPPLNLTLTLPAKSTYTIASENSKDWGIDANLSSGTRILICTGCQISLPGCYYRNDGSYSCTTSNMAIGNYNFTQYNNQSGISVITGNSNSNGRSITIYPVNHQPLTELDLHQLENIFNSFQP